jgi:hypothetical protein
MAGAVMGCAAASADDADADDADDDDTADDNAADGEGDEPSSDGVNIASKKSVPRLLSICGRG